MKTLLLLLIPFFLQAQSYKLLNAGLQRGSSATGAYLSFAFHPAYSKRGTPCKDIYFSFEAEGLKLTEGALYLGGSVNGYARIGEDNGSSVHPILTSGLGGYVAPHPALFLQAGAGVEVKGFHLIALIKCIDHMSDYLPKYPLMVRGGYSVSW